MRSTRITLGSLSLACILMVIPPQLSVAFPATSQATVARLFRGILPILHHTGVPAVLPTTPLLVKYYATIVDRGPGHYDVLIGYVPNCMGHACEFGDVEAHKLPAKAHRPSGHAVKLPHNVVGYFMNFTCGANCGDTTVRFDLHGYRYTYGIKAGTKSDVMKLATSAVLAGPV